MSRVEIKDDPLNDLIRSIDDNEKTFGNAVIRMVIARKDESSFLYDGRIDFTYKNDPIPKDIADDYGKMLLVRRVIQIKELIEILKTSSTKIMKIKDLDEIHVEGLDDTKFHIASKMHYLDVYHEWSFMSYKFSVKDDVYLNDIYEPLIKTELRLYPDGYEAVQSFLDLNRKPNNNNPYGLRILLPDYSARINTFDISDENIEITIDEREISYDNLLVKLFAKKRSTSDPLSTDLEISKNGSTPDPLSTDLEISKNGITKFDFPFAPDEVNVYLIERKTSKTIDYRDYGNYKTKMYEGMTIRTSQSSKSDLTNKESIQTPTKGKLYKLGEQYDFYKDLKKIIQNASKEVFIVDAYPDVSLYELYIEYVPTNVPVKILTKKPPKDFVLVGKMLLEKHPLEIVLSETIHDRFVFVDNRCWTIGSSIKDGGKKPTLMVELDVQDTLYNTWLEYFKNGKKLL